jgi:hypothetical protein
MELSRWSKQRHRPDRSNCGPWFPIYSASFDWGNIDQFSFNREQLTNMKKTCHCFCTLNHNLAHGYNDARVIKCMWENANREFQGGVRSFED